MKKLNVFYRQKLVGSLIEDNEERLTFQYEDSWINDEDHFSLSLALKVRKESYDHLATKSFFENLLPEGEVKKILEMKSPENIGDELNFLKKFGVDCAGAFVITDADSLPTPTSFESKEIKLETIYKYLAQKRSVTEAIVNQEGGRFSLAGAQDKFPIILRRNKFYIPLNGEPTTHILKPHVMYFEDTTDTPFNEYFCMLLAADVGLNIPKVDVIVGQYPLYLIERFDRVFHGKNLVRIHVQDFCQAHGFTSKKKYEDDGGPTLVQNYRLIKNNSFSPLKDLDQFLKWIWFNLIIGNNDCHSKNLSFITTDEGLRLSPFYDLLCTVIYKGMTNKFSYSIGKQFKWFDLKNRNFEGLAKELEIDSNLVFKIGKEMIDKIDSMLPDKRAEFEKAYPNIKTVHKIEKEIEKRIRHLRSNIPRLK